MPSNFVFQPPMGLGFPQKKTPTFNTQIKSPASGRGELRVQLQVWPIWLFDLPFNYLKGTEAVQSAYQYVIGVFGSMGGQAQSFLYQDPNDNTVSPGGDPGTTGGFLAIGDGTTTSFQLVRQIGTLTDIVQNPITVQPYINDQPQVGNWTQNYAGVITFASPPAAGSLVAWGGTFYYRVRFDQDSLDDMQMEWPGLFSCSSVKLRSVII